MSSARHDLAELVEWIPPDVHYDEHLAVGQALHHEGYSVEVWRSWCAGCTQPDHAKRLKEIDYKWGTFGNNSGVPVTGGTIVKMARDYGWGPSNDKGERTGKPLDFDAVIGGHDEDPIIDAASVGEYDEDVRPLYAEGHEVDEFVSYLEALFEPSDIVGYVCDYKEEDKDGETRYKPGSRGAFTRTMNELRDAVLKSGMEDGLGYTLHAESGAWMRFNPLDGQGVGNANVTSYRFALLESDEMPQGKFASIVKQLNLPVAAMVDSGNKSLHAIVRIDATDAKQYAMRVNTLYERCEKNGIAVDKANKNASRLSRMPGVMRNGRRQFLAGLSSGAADWDEWEEWYAEATDELPDASSLDAVFEDLPPLKPELIEGVLRVGHKMLVSGPSKAGKSFALIALCIAFASGGTWFGLKCRKSRVMYVNLELDGDSCVNRFNDMFNELGIDKASASAIQVWNLRGKTQEMRKLLPKLVRRCLKANVEVVVIDPIYKVMVGDENSAGDMAQFANLFDELCDKAGVSAIYCHHHSKGYQGDKRSIDRASGSGVFGRDPDAILDMVELDADDGARWKYVQDKCCKLCEDAVANESDEQSALWEALPEVARNIERNAIENAKTFLSDESYAELEALCGKVKAGKDALTAWRIEGTLREFPKFAPVSAWFDWPLHVIDPALSECGEIGAEKPKPGKGKKKPDTRKEKPDEEQARAYAEINAAIEKAVRYCEEDEVPATRENVRQRIPDIAGKPPTKRQILDWTRRDKAWSQWCMGDVIDGDSRGAKVVTRKQ